MLYVFLKQSAIVNENSSILLEDVANVYGSAKEDVDKIKKIIVGQIEQELSIISALDVIKAIKDDSAVVNGEQVCNVTPFVKEKKGVVYYGKVIFIALLLLIGGAATIINFNTDVEMIRVHEIISRVLTGGENFSRWISIAYSLGIGFGVIFFANMLPNKKSEPTIFDIEQGSLVQQTQAFIRSQKDQKLRKNKK